MEEDLKYLLVPHYELHEEFIPKLHSPLLKYHHIYMEDIKVRFEGPLHVLFPRNEYNAIFIIIPLKDAIYPNNNMFDILTEIYHISGERAPVLINIGYNNLIELDGIKTSANVYYQRYNGLGYKTKLISKSVTYKVTHDDDIDNERIAAINMMQELSNFNFTNLTLYDLFSKIIHITVHGDFKLYMGEFFKSTELNIAKFLKSTND